MMMIGGISILLIGKAGTTSGTPGSTLERPFANDRARGAQRVVINRKIRKADE
jgi:hypothetical protein